MSKLDKFCEQVAVESGVAFDPTTVLLIIQVIIAVLNVMDGCDFVRAELSEGKFQAARARHSSDVSFWDALVAREVRRQAGTLGWRWFQRRRIFEAIVMVSMSWSEDDLVKVSTEAKRVTEAWM